MSKVEFSSSPTHCSQDEVLKAFPRKPWRHSFHQMDPTCGLSSHAVICQSSSTKRLLNSRLRERFILDGHGRHPLLLTAEGNVETRRNPSLIYCSGMCSRAGLAYFLHSPCEMMAICFVPTKKKCVSGRSVWQLRMNNEAVPLVHFRTINILSCSVCWLIYNVWPRFNYNT